MVLRRSHKKSRLGCLTCKQRRVKCDESGPPCGPCEARGCECEYVQAKGVPAQRRSEPVNGSNQTTPQQPSPANWSQSERLLELELMQQWTSKTFKSYCGTIEDEYHNWQVFFPKLALKHDCLLDGLFAMSALEIGAFSEHSDSQDYIDAALEYQNRASAKLREALSNADFETMPQDRHQALWALSSILMVLALAMPPYAVQPLSGKYSMLDHILTYLELLKGFAVIAMAKGNRLKDDPMLNKYKEWDELESLPVGPEIQTAFDRLKALNEETYGEGRVSGLCSELVAMANHAACRRAIFFLEQCQAKCSESHTRAYGLAWPIMAGEDFIAAMKAKEPLALLILMHWGVFIEKQSYGIWYVERVGKHLVEDLSNEISLLDNVKARDAISWVRQQVELDVVAS